MFIRNLSNRTLTFKDGTGTIYSTPAYGNLEVSDSLWTDNEFRKALRLRIREIEIESVTAGGGGAPDNAQYVTASTNAGLSNELVLGTQVIMAGTLAGRPAASLNGRLYYITDSSAPRLTRDTGTVWVDMLHGVTHQTGGLDALVGNLDANARVGIRKNSGSVLSTRRNLNLIEGTGVTITVADDGANEEAEITFSGGSFPPGAIMMFAAGSAPTGWLFCDGSAVSRTTYAALFATVTTTYGAGNGSTTFNLPDMRGRFAVGLGTHSDVNALGDSDNMGTVGDRRPTHKHSVNDPGHGHIYYTGNDVGTNAAADGDGATYSGVTTSSFTGISVGVQSNTPTDTVPYLTLNYIIKT